MSSQPSSAGTRQPSKQAQAQSHSFPAPADELTEALEKVRLSGQPAGPDQAPEGGVGPGGGSRKGDRDRGSVALSSSGKRKDGTGTTPSNAAVQKAPPSSQPKASGREPSKKKASPSKPSRSSTPPPRPLSLQGPHASGPPRTPLPSLVPGSYSAALRGTGSPKAPSSATATNSRASLDLPGPSSSGHPPGLGLSQRGIGADHPPGSSEPPSSGSSTPSRRTGGARGGDDIRQRAEAARIAADAAARAAEILSAQRSAAASHANSDDDEDFVQPSGPRRTGEGTEEEEQGVISVERTPTGGVLLRVTLLAAGFVIGPSGASIRTLGKQKGADIKSWSERAKPEEGLPRPTRVFVVEGPKASVIEAVSIIRDAVARYKELCEGSFAGQSVSRIQNIRGIDFSYCPPPRSTVPFAAALRSSTALFQSSNIPSASEVLAKAATILSSASQHAAAGSSSGGGGTAAAASHYGAGLSAAPASLGGASQEAMAASGFAGGTGPARSTGSGSPLVSPSSNVATGGGPSRSSREFHPHHPLHHGAALRHPAPSTVGPGSGDPRRTSISSDRGIDDPLSMAQGFGGPSTAGGSFPASPQTITAPSGHPHSAQPPSMMHPPGLSSGMMHPGAGQPPPGMAAYGAAGGLALGGPNFGLSGLGDSAASAAGANYAAALQLQALQQQQALLQAQAFGLYNATLPYFGLGSGVGGMGPAAGAFPPQGAPFYGAGGLNQFAQYLEQPLPSFEQAQEAAVGGGGRGQVQDEGEGAAGARAAGEAESEEAVGLGATATEPLAHQAPPNEGGGRRNAEIAD